MAASETGRGLRLLSLDGGGIRGLSELLIIEEIMKRIQHQSKLQHVPRPAEYFDLIGGTSTGGLIAILLGRLGLSAGEAIQLYKRLAERVFSEKKWKFQDGTFKATILEKEIKKVVTEKLGPSQDGAKMLEDEDEGNGCKMFVCAMPALNTAFPRRFRNYHVGEHESYNCTIWEAGRATSAAPTFFKRIEIGGEDFVDAGLGCNNPIKEVISEARLVFGEEGKVDCIVSIGTGKSGVVGFDEPTGFQKLLPLALVDVLRKIATESSKTAEDIQKRYADATDLYFRFDVDQGLQDVGLDEWKRLKAVQTHTIAYTMEDEVNRKINRAIATLTGKASPRPYSLSQLDGQVSSKNKPTSNVPLPLDRDFVDRGDIMAQISDNCSRPGARVALLGFGGIGKSQLAIEYAHRVRDNLPETWVFWVHASNQARMEQGFQQMAETLRIPGRDDPETNIFQIVGQWLKNTSEKWLLVVDNADDPIMFSRLAREEKAKEESGKESLRLLMFPPLVTPYLPHNQNGSILITSRNEEASIALVGEDKNIIYVGEMNEKESLDLLLRKLNEKVDRHGASDLVNALDHIPLAITQAAAFLSRQKGRVSISQYVKDLDKSIEKIIDHLKPEFVNPRRDDSAVNSILATWRISFDQIRQKCPAAAEMLSLMSFFNYQGIPESLLHDDEGPAPSQDFEKHLQILRDYCFVYLGEDNSTFRMHRLVQASTQDWLKSHGNHETLGRTYLRIISTALPSSTFNEWERFRQLLPHLESATSHEPSDKVSTGQWAKIVSRFSRYKSSFGGYEEAEEMIRNVVERLERLFGEGHRSTFRSLRHLAIVLRERGQLEAAEETVRLLIDRTRKSVDESNPAMLGHMALLASILIDRGQYKEAETILRSVVEAAQLELSEDNHRTQKYLGSLARAIWKQSRNHEAEMMYRQLLEKGERRFQGDNIYTWSLWNNLAATLKEQRKFEEAEQICYGVLEGIERLIGPDAPRTIRCRINLAFLLVDSGKYEEAEMFGRQALEKMERVLGNEHPDVFSCLVALARALWRQKDFTEAEQKLRRAVDGRVKCLGEGHPATVEAKNDLETLLRDQRESNGEGSE